MKDIREELMDSMEDLYWKIDTSVNSVSMVYESLNMVQVFVLSLPFDFNTHL